MARPLHDRQPSVVETCEPDLGDVAIEEAIFAGRRINVGELGRAGSLLFGRSRNAR